MGYIKLICFCIWAVQKIGSLGDKQVTQKRPGKILSLITAIVIALQIASGIALSVYGTLIQSIPSSKLPSSVNLPVVWWIGIVPIVAGIFGIIAVYQRRRKRIVIWILINGGLCLGNGILMSYTDVLTETAYGLKPDDIDRCKSSSWIDPVTTTTIATTTTTTTLSPFYHHHGENYHGGENYNGDENHNRGELSEGSRAAVRLSCEMVKTLGVELIPGLTYSLLTYLGLVILVTVFSSVIGCCLQECVQDESYSGPEFVPVEQTMDRGRMSQQFLAAPAGHRGEMFAPLHSSSQDSYPGYAPQPAIHQPTSYWQSQYPQGAPHSGYPSHMPQTQFWAAGGAHPAPTSAQRPSAPTGDNHSDDGSEGFHVESERQLLM